MSKKLSNKSFIIAALSALVQYYDHHLFGLLAAKISKFFIPTVNDTVQLLNTYFIMAIAVTAKPIGALVLGRIGDVFGRSATFNISLIGTAMFSMIIGITPGYQQIGLISALVLLLARMCICGFVSSGTDGIRIYIYEHIGKNKQCYGNGFITAFTLGGSFVASVSAWFFTLDFMPEYGWRGAFLLGSLMGVGILLLRKKLKTNDEISAKDEPGYEEFKNLSTLRIVSKHLKLFCICAILAGCIGSTNQFIIIFFGTYNFETLKVIDQSTMRFFTSVAIVLYMLFAIVGGYIADIAGKYKTAFFSAFLLLLAIISLSKDLAKGQTSIETFLVCNILLPFLIMPSLALLKQSIPKVIRYRIFSLAHAVGSICISAPTAFVATLLYHKTKIAWLPMLHFAIVIILMVYTIILLRNNKDSHQVD